MPDEPSDPSPEFGLQKRAEASLVKLSGNESPALSEMVSRSLVRIRTSIAPPVRHRIGEHELCEPDYRLVCAIAEDEGETPEKVLQSMLEGPEGGNIRTKIVNGQFKSLRIDGGTLPSAEWPQISGLVIEDLSVTHLLLPKLDLSLVPMLRKLEFVDNPLAELDFSVVPQLKKLDCSATRLTELDLSAIPQLTELCCSLNQLTELDLSVVPQLTHLSCDHNQLPVLDIRPLNALEDLRFDGHKTKLLQRSGQNF